MGGWVSELLCTRPIHTLGNPSTLQRAFLLREELGPVLVSPMREETVCSATEDLSRTGHEELLPMPPLSPSPDG